jgi:hypothetical protein
MISDQDAIVLTCVVALCTLIASIAYIFLISKFKQSISSNDGLKSEIVQLRADLAQSRQDNAVLKTTLDNCLGKHFGG